MILFDISDTSIEAVKLSKSFFTGEVINAFNRVEFTDGLVRAGEIQKKDALKKTIVNLLKDAKPKEIKDQECAFTLPDKRTYTHRFNLSQRKDSQTVSSLIKAQAEQLIPQPIEELAYDYNLLDQKEEARGEGEIFLAAVPATLLDGYLELFNGLGLKPELAVPESLAAYRFLASMVQAGEAVLYLDVGEKVTTATLMDKQGVVEAFTEPVQTSELVNRVGELLKFSSERLGKEVDRIILGGGGSLKMDTAKAEDKLKVTIASVEEAFKGFKLPIKVNFGDLSKIVFVNVLGLALLSKEEKPLNLIKT